MQIPTPLVSRVLKIIPAMCGNVAFGYKGALCIAGIKNNTRVTVQPPHHLLPTIYTGIKNNTRINERHRPIMSAPNSMGIKNNTRINGRYRRHYVCPSSTGIKNNTRAL